MNSVDASVEDFTGVSSAKLLDLLYTQPLAHVSQLDNIVTTFISRSEHCGASIENIYNISQHLWLASLDAVPEAARSLRFAAGALFFFHGRYVLGKDLELRCYDEYLFTISIQCLRDALSAAAVHGAPSEQSLRSSSTWSKIALQFLRLLGESAAVNSAPRELITAGLTATFSYLLSDSIDANTVRTESSLWFLSTSALAHDLRAEAVLALLSLLAAQVSQRPETCDRLLEQLSKWSPDVLQQARYFCLRALSLLATGRASEALQHARRAIQFDEHSTRAKLVFLRVAFHGDSWGTGVPGDGTMRDPHVSSEYSEALSVALGVVCDESASVVERMLAYRLAAGAKAYEFANKAFDVLLASMERIGVPPQDVIGLYTCHLETLASHPSSVETALSLADTVAKWCIGLVLPAATLQPFLSLLGYLGFLNYQAERFELCVQWWERLRAVTKALSVKLAEESSVSAEYCRVLCALAFVAIAQKNFARALELLSDWERVVGATTASADAQLPGRLLLFQAALTMGNMELAQTALDALVVSKKPDVLARCAQIAFDGRRYTMAFSVLRDLASDPSFALSSLPFTRECFLRNMVCCCVNEIKENSSENLRWYRLISETAAEACRDVNNDDSAQWWWALCWTTASMWWGDQMDTANEIHQDACFCELLRILCAERVGTVTASAYLRRCGLLFKASVVMDNLGQPWNRPYEEFFPRHELSELKKLSSLDLYLPESVSEFPLGVSDGLECPSGSRPTVSLSSELRALTVSQRNPVLLSLLEVILDPSGPGIHAAAATPGVACADMLALAAWISGNARIDASSRPPLVEQCIIHALGLVGITETFTDVVAQDNALRAAADCMDVFSAYAALYTATGGNGTRNRGVLTHLVELMMKSDKFTQFHVIWVVATCWNKGVGAFSYNDYKDACAWCSLALTACQTPSFTHPELSQLQGQFQTLLGG